jgi:glycosyltransferase involved in cell wall biosynthesis
MTKVGIVITNYNYEQYLVDCLQSCIDQTYKLDEIIVVDDCSTDESTKVVTAFMDKGPVTLVSMPRNQGYASARNEGIRRCTCDLIAELDADDMLLPDSIKDRAMFLIENEQYDIAHGIAMRYYTEDGSIRGHNPKTYIHPQGRMFRRNVFEKFGLYFEGLRAKADKEMVFRLGVHPQSPLPKLVKDKKLEIPVAFYRKHPTQMHRLRNADKAYDKAIDAIFKRRIKQIKKEGITRDNTLFLEPLNG